MMRETAYDYSGSCQIKSGETVTASHAVLQRILSGYLEHRAIPLANYKTSETGDQISFRKVGWPAVLFRVDSLWTCFSTGRPGAADSFFTIMSRARKRRGRGLCGVIVCLSLCVHAVSL